MKYEASRETYRNRVERFIRENKDHITIRKLNTNNPITLDEITELERILFDGDNRWANSFAVLLSLTPAPPGKHSAFI